MSLGLSSAGLAALQHQKDQLRKANETADFLRAMLHEALRQLQDNARHQSGLQRRPTTLAPRGDSVDEEEKSLAHLVDWHADWYLARCPQ